MVEKIRIKLARLLASDYIREVDNRVNRRVARILDEMDPFEPLLKKFQGVFSKEYQHPEDKLDERSQILMTTWGYQQRDDPSFKYMMEWVMNTQANETIKRGPVTVERMLYCRAQIASMILFKQEVDRLALKYEELLNKGKEGFDKDLSVE